MGIVLGWKFVTQKTTDAQRKDSLCSPDMTQSSFSTNKLLIIKDIKLLHKPLSTALYKISLN